MKHQIVLNKTSGGGRSGKKWKKIKQFLEEEKYEYDLHVTEYHTHAIELGKELAHYGEIIVVGGDGTAHEVANGILLSGVENCKLGIISTGTGKDLPNTLGVPVDYKEAYQTIVEGHTRKIDVAKITKIGEESDSRLFLAVASLGFDAEVNYRANKGIKGKKLPGTLNYVLAIVTSLLKLKSRKLLLTIDGTTKEITSAFMAIGNGRYYGGGIMICPGASMYDSEFQITTVGEKKISRLKLMRVLPKAYDGKHVPYEEVRVYRGRKIRVEMADKDDKPCLYQVDGEIMGHIPVEVEFIDKKLEIYIPKSYDEKEDILELEYDQF